MYHLPVPPHPAQMAGPAMKGLGGNPHHYLGHFAKPSVLAEGHNTVETIPAEHKGQQPIHFKKGALHRELGVPEGEKIPAKKMASARSGKLGPLAEKRANFAKNVLHHGG